MRHLSERCGPVDMPYTCLRMDFDQRQKVRSRVLATNGEFVGVHIQRGTSLKDGDHLRSSDGTVFVVRAKREPLSMVECHDPLHLARAAYHLGNRHIRVQVSDGRVTYQTDHVIDEMLAQLGLDVVHVELPFEPEPGAYHKHGSSGAGSVAGGRHSKSGHHSHGHHSHEHHSHGHHSHEHGHDLDQDHDHDSDHDRGSDDESDHGHGMSHARELSPDPSSGVDPNESELSSAVRSAGNLS